MSFIVSQNPPSASAPINPPPRPADERGFTLQTLIVIAVMVVVAVVAGVVLIALSGNASNDLEESDGDLEALCGPGEIFDPQLHAAGHGGLAAHGGIKSSAIGCWQFCYIESNELFGYLNPAENFKYPEYVLETPGTEGARTNTWWLRHSTEKTNQQTQHTSVIAELRRSEKVRFTVLPVVGPHHADGNSKSFRANNPVLPYPLGLVELDTSLRGPENYAQRPYEISVHPSNEYCVVRNADTKETVFRSTELRPTSEHEDEARASTRTNCRPRRGLDGDRTPETGPCETSGADGIETP